MIRPIMLDDSPCLLHGLWPTSTRVSVACEEDATTPHGRVRTAERRGGGGRVARGRRRTGGKEEEVGGRQWGGGAI